MLASSSEPSLPATAPKQNLLYVDEVLNKRKKWRSRSCEEFVQGASWSIKKTDAKNNPQTSLDQRSSAILSRVSQPPDFSSLEQYKATIEKVHTLTRCNSVSSDSSGTLTPGSWGSEITIVPATEGQILFHEDETRHSASNPDLRKGFSPEDSRPPVQEAIEDEQHTSETMPMLDDSGSLTVHRSQSITSENITRRIPHPFTSQASQLHYSRQTSTFPASDIHSQTQSVLSLIESVLDPAILHSTQPMTNADFIKIIVTRIACNAASGTISADFLAYLGFPAAAMGCILGMGSVGLIDGLYSCGEKLHREEGHFKVNCIIRTISILLYQIGHVLIKHIPDTVTICGRKAYLYGSVSGTASTVLADIFAHAYAANLLTSSNIVSKLCPVILALGTTIGAAGGVVRGCSRNRSSVEQEAAPLSWEEMA